MKIQMLKGLPASGKSTYARDLVENNGNWVRVNFDDLRSMMNNGKWSRGREKIVQEVAYDIADEALAQGKNVVWDNTSFHPKHEKRLRAIADHFNADFEIMSFDIDPEEAIKRDLKRANSVGPQVIWDMYYRYVWEEPTHMHGDIPAIIVDMDGTLAHNDGHRGWYDWDKVGGDACVEEIRRLANMYFEAGHAVLVVTGRDGSSYEITEEWLVSNKIYFHDLYSRAEGDNRPDHVVKKEIYFEHIANLYDVHLVIDDREQVVRMWSDDLGLKTLQVKTPGQCSDF